MQKPPKRRLLRQLASLLNRRERRNAVLLLLLMITQAGAELVGVASIAPFMGVVADASLIHSNQVLATLYQWGGFTTNTGFLVALGVMVAITITFTNVLVSVTTWATNRFAWNTHHKLSVRMLRGYLAQPYSFFVDRNTAELSKNILSEIQLVIQGVLLPSLQLVSRSLVVLAIVGLLLFVDPILALGVVVVLGGAYGAIFMAIRRRQRRMGVIRRRANALRFKLAGEALGGIKDVKVLQREAAFAERYVQPSQEFSSTMAINQTLSVVPRYLLETIAFSSVVLIVVYYLQAGQGIATILPTLSLYAFAGLRLMPALQAVFSGLSVMRFNRPSLDALVEDISRFGSDTLPENSQPLQPLQNAIQLSNISFKYTGTGRNVLDGISLTIQKNQTIGLVGASGSGKTTLVDVLLGLYQPQKGEIRIDNIVLTADNLPAWRQQVGYVPQHIYLTDDSLANNIAFGVPPQEVDLAKVEHAARIAHLHEFISELPEQYNTIVGERGVRLSGGQRQRIGIARALYNDPEVLVMDEATSALDGQTEDAVMEAINQLSGQKTIVLIAHRLTTVEECDCIYLMNEGRVLEHGRYTDLLDKSKDFRFLARVP